MGRGVIFYPHYVGDYQSHTMHLTTEQHGAYFLMREAYYATGKPLPANADALASITKLPLARFKAHERVLKAFFKLKNGELYHARIEEELDKIEGKSNKNKHSAMMRWHPPGTSGGNANASPKAPKSHVRPVSHSESESESESYKATSVSNMGNVAFEKTSRFGKILTHWRGDGSNPKYMDSLARCMEVLESEEMNRCHKRWHDRWLENPKKLERVLADVEAAKKAKEIKQSIGKYAEDTWKRFA